MLNAFRALALLCVATAASAAGTTLDVKVIDRHEGASTYTYMVPGYSTGNAAGSVNCTSFGSSTNCTGSGTSSATSAPGFVASYQVKGATLALELPDGRIAVVNCDSKVNLTEWTNPNLYRNCRIPLVNAIQATFVKDKATLRWSVSIDGKTMQSETYKILAVLDKPAGPEKKD